MQLITEPTVNLVAHTMLKWDSLDDIEPTWDPSPFAPDGDLVAEFGGRQCYQSWANPAKRSTEEYLANILQHGHLSVLEHATATFQFKGISRSLTHELIRHRHLSPSQVSQRYVPETDANFICPLPIEQDEVMRGIFVDACLAAQRAYDELLDRLETVFQHLENPTDRKKAARQAARSVMPNATETQMVLTGNYRAWRWFLKMRTSEHADPEIRRLAVAVLRELQQLSRAVFGDFQIVTLPDGTEAAHTHYPH